jgi:hypothetical protein
VHVVIASCQKRAAQRLEKAGLVAIEMIGKDQVQSGAGLRLVFVVPVRVVPRPAAGHLIRGEPEEKEVLLTCLAAISMVAPSRVPAGSAPFIINFMLLVPLAS